MNYDTKQISVALEGLHNSKDISDAAYSTLKYAIKQLTLGGVVVSDADIYLASADEKVDLLDARGFRQGAKWCRRQY